MAGVYKKFVASNEIFTDHTMAYAGAKRRYSAYAGTAYNVGKRVYQGYKLGRRLSTNPNKRVRTQKRTNSSKVITQQHDFTSTTKKRRMSAKKKKWVKFVEKVKKAEAYSDTMITLVENNATLFRCSNIYGANRQNLFPNSNSVAHADLRLGVYRSFNPAGVFRYMDQLTKQASAATQTGVLSKPLRGEVANKEIMIKSSSMSISIKNITDQPTNTYEGGEPDNIYADIYECVSRQPITDSNYVSAQGCWTACLGEGASPTAVATGDSIGNWTKAEESQSGLTPYHAKRFGRYWKILKKTRILIQPAAIINYKATGYRGKVDFSEDFEELDSIPKGKCKDFVIVINPTFNVITGDPQKQFAQVQWTKSYHIAYDGNYGPEQSYSGQYDY